MLMRIVGIGFPRSQAVPSHVTACGDGIHTAVARAGLRTDCVCERMTIDLTGHPQLPPTVRVVLVDAAMDGAEIGETRRVAGRLVAP